MSDVDGQQDARLDRIDARLRDVEAVVIELRALVKMVRPVLILLGASLGIDLAPMLM